MVKIRLRRIGTKGRPFYRVVVCPSTSGRNGRFVEVLGTYDPVSKPKMINIKEDRALHWLINGAQPSETAAILLSKIGVLDKYFAERPSAKAKFTFLDKRTAAISVKSVIETPAEAPKKEKKVEEPVTEAVPEAVADAPAQEVAAEAIAVEETPAAAEETPAEEAPAEEPAAEENA